jgi:hypothetical protein
MMAKILERWYMELLPDPSGEAWYQDWAIKSPAGISRSITAGWHAYSALAHVGLTFQSAGEYFAGIGAQTLIIDNLFHPATHRIQDYSAGAVAHLERVAPVGVHVRQADSYDPENGLDCDLVGLDFGDMTVWKTRPGEAHRALLDQVFSLEPRAVVLTDVAGPRLHLHKTRYDTLLGAGACDTYQGYLEALAVRFQAMYGYTLLAGFYHKAAAKLAFVPGYGSSGPIALVPVNPIGLEVH